MMQQSKLARLLSANYLNFFSSMKSFFICAGLRAMPKQDDNLAEFRLVQSRQETLNVLFGFDVVKVVGATV
jgi:hypothetical protein